MLQIEKINIKIKIWYQKSGNWWAFMIQCKSEHIFCHKMSYIFILKLFIDKWTRIPKFFNRFSCSGSNRIYFDIKTDSIVLICVKQNISRFEMGIISPGKIVIRLDSCLVESTEEWIIYIAVSDWYRKSLFHQII